MGAKPLYDGIGTTYATTRREDPRVAARIWAQLAPGPRVVNVGAGSGSYEPPHKAVVAVEPSQTMIRQRQPDHSLSVVKGVAEALPFADDAFDSALAVLTVHHWTDQPAGLREMRRVSTRQVVLFYEPLEVHRFWGLEYFPEARNLRSEREAPGEPLIRSQLRVREVIPVLVPRDCLDGFGAAFWGRPEAYLDPAVQAGMSWLALLPDDARRRGTSRLASDLASGAWDARHGHLRTMNEYDTGYRLAVAE